MKKPDDNFVVQYYKFIVAPILITVFVWLMVDRFLWSSL